MNTENRWLDPERPTLETKRLILRPFAVSDAKDVQRLAGHPLVAATTLAIPHPYPDGAAEEWIGQHAGWFTNRRAVQFAITLKPKGEVIGCIDLMSYSVAHAKAELGYFVGVDFWGQGYCTEAAHAVIKYGFEIMHLNRVVARHMAINPPSGKVMLKIGMKKEGLLRGDILKNGVFQDIVVYGLTREDYSCTR